MKDLFGIKRKRLEKEKKESRSTGVYVSDVPGAGKRDRKINGILLNGLLNAVIVITTVMSVLESFKIQYYRGIMCFFIVALSLFAASFYINIIFKITGYVCVIAGFVYGITEYTAVLRGGFGTIANKFMEVIEVVLDLPIERRYAEYTLNRELAVTLCAVFLGGAFALLFNIVITETKGFIIVLFFTFPFVQLGIYFNRNINIYVFILYMAALTALMILRTGHYKNETRKKSGYNVKRKKNTYEYDYISNNGNGLARALRIIFIFVIVAIIISVIYPKGRFDINNSSDGMKENTKEFAKKVSLVGFWGMLNPNGSGNGGIGRSKLGQADRVRLDYQKDLDVITAVFPEEKNIYLRAYTGTTYEDNNWKYISESKPANYKPLEEYGLTSNDVASLNGDILKNDTNHLLVNKEKMIYVYNTFANNLFRYIPENVKDGNQYYNTVVNDDEFVGKLDYGYGIKCWYYNLRNDLTLEDMKTYAEQLKNDNSSEKIYDIEEKYREYVYNTYLEVPAENKKVIDDILNENGISEDDSLDNVYKIIDLFDNQYEYTLMPGKTPNGKDFVNYFLKESKKGYCSYFASSAVLMFRELGIPARYTGGYMVSTTDSDYMSEDMYSREMDESVVAGMKKGEYTVYDIEVNDSDAHAWTEVYIDNLGWVPVDVTPPSDDEDTSDDSQGIGVLLNNLFNSNTVESVKNTAINMAVMVIVLGAISVVAGAAAILIIKYRRKRCLDIDKNYRYLIRIAKAGGLKWNNRIVLERLGDELTEYDICNQEDTEKLITIIEKAKYSNTGVSEDEMKNVNIIINKIADNIYGNLSFWKKIRYSYLF